MNNIVNICFIVCRGRSGSTLLQSLLDAHPNICAPIESRLILYLASKYKSVKVWDYEIKASFCRDVFVERRFKLFWNVPKEKLLKKFKQTEINSFEDAVKTVFLCHSSEFQKETIRLVVDKNPPYSQFVTQLHKIFQQAHFIYLYREPKSVVYSHIKAFHKHHIYRLSLQWVYSNRILLAFYDDHNQKMIKIKYETLVRQPEITLKKILTFLNLPYSKDLLDSYRVIKKNIYKNKYLNLPHHREIAQPINERNLYKWKGYFTDKELKIINFICYKYADRLGYLTDYKKLNFMEYGRLFMVKCQVKLVYWIKNVFYDIPLYFRHIVMKTISLFFDKKYKDR